MSYSIKIKEKAVALRKQGYSIKQIAEKMNIAKSTSSVWVGDIYLNDFALKRLADRKNLGRLKSATVIKNKGLAIREKLKDSALENLAEIVFDKTLCKLLCSILFWTEGGKYTDSFVYFINSDPKMIKVFVKLLRLSFEIDEQKFRALVHIHNYHNENEIKDFWSKITGIPISQFNKSYLKQNTQKRIRIGYQGCVRIRYYDFKIALELRSFYNALEEII